MPDVNNGELCLGMGDPGDNFRVSTLYLHYEFYQKKGENKYLGWQSCQNPTEIGVLSSYPFQLLYPWPNLARNNNHGNISQDDGFELIDQLANWNEINR